MAYSQTVVYLLTKKVKRKSQTTIGVCVTLEPINILDLDKIATIIRFIYSMSPKGGIDYVVFRLVVNFIKGKFYDSADPVLEYLKSKRELRKFYQMYHNFLYEGAQLPASFFKLAQSKIESEVKPILNGTDIKVIYLKSKFEGINNKTHPFKTCLASPWYIYVGSDGTVYHCCDLGLNSQVAIGNLLNNTLQEIWQSEKRKKVTEFINSEGLNTLCPPICALYDLNKFFSKIESLLTQAGTSDLRLNCH